MQTLTITTPDDWHCHLRDGEYLNTTVNDIAKRFDRAIVMPNLVPPVTTVSDAEAYHARILSALPSNLHFNPLMTLYLTDNTTTKTALDATKSPQIKAFKLYPAGATTNADHGVTNIENIYPICEVLAEQGMPLLVHGEVTHPEVDIFDREKHFIDDVLAPLLQRFPALRVVFEHITTKEAVDFVNSANDNVAATITAHHLLLNRNHLLAGGIRPHYYCLPVLKRNTHQDALITAATSGSLKFFLGTDSAPHTQANKESPCGCAGIYTAHAAIELYAEAFEQAGHLDKLERFASVFGPTFYKLPKNTTKMSLVKKPWHVAEKIRFGNEQLIPFRAGEMIQWEVALYV